MSHVLTRFFALTLGAALVSNAEILPPAGLGQAGGTPPPPGPQPPPAPALARVGIRATDPYALVGLTSGDITVFRTLPSTNDLVIQVLIGGTATNGIDYAEITNVVTIPAGQRATDVLIEPIAGGTLATNRFVELTLQTNSAYQFDGPRSAKVAIGTPTPLPATTKPLPEVRISASDAVALEGATTGAFTLERNGDLTQSLTVSVAYSGSATNGINYAALTNRVTIPAGRSSAELIVSPLGGAPYGHDLTVLANLAESTNYTAAEPEKVKVTIVENTLHDLPPMVVITSPTNSATLTGDTVTLTASVSSGGVPVQFVAFFEDGAFISSSASAPYSASWNHVRPGAYTLRAWAQDADGLWAVSDPVNITVDNQSPVIAIGSPTNGTVALAPANITIDALVIDPAGVVTNVNFQVNGHKVGSVAFPPYLFTVKNEPAGSYALEAIAETSTGGSSKSQTVTITLTNPAPAVVLTSPTNQQSFGVATPIPLAAKASVTPGKIQSVGFYADGFILGVSTNPPYAFTWTNAFPGKYSLRARARSSGGGIAWSDAVSIAVTDQAPTVNITAPLTGASVHVGADVVITADASDPDDGVYEVVFWVNKTPVGSSKAAPYSASWTPKKAGAYTLEAVAYDHYGLSAKAATVALTVTN